MGSNNHNEALFHRTCDRHIVQKCIKTFFPMFRPFKQLEQNCMCSEITCNCLQSNILQKGGNLIENASLNLSECQFCFSLDVYPATFSENLSVMSQLIFIDEWSQRWKSHYCVPDSLPVSWLSSKKCFQQLSSSKVHPKP